MNDPFLSSAKSLVRAKESLIKRRGAPSGRLFSGLIVSAIGLITTGFAQAQTDLPPPPVAFDFEAPAFIPGSIDGQRGWVVDQGRAEVVAGKGFQGSAGLVLRPLQPFSQARVSLEGKRRPAPVCFVDLQVLPIASEVLEKAELLDVNSARIGLFRSGGSDSASVWVFDGDGVGGGAWLETRMKVPVDAATGRSVTWHRLTVREDIQRQSWDLWLDGSWLAAGLGFQEARPPEAATCILMGDRKEPVFLDDLSIAAVNPLTDDQDADGLGDLLEKQLGFDPARDDRDEDADGDGVANLDQAVQSAATLKQAPLTAARHVMAAPQWSIPPGILNKPAKLMMTAMDAESSIYYTMDGSDPRAEGAGRQMFSGVFDLSSTMVIKAAAVSATGRWSAVVSGAWIFPDQVMDQQRPEGWPLTFEDTARDQRVVNWPVPYTMQLPSAVKANAARQSVNDAILAAPVIVLMADPDALVGEKAGIYSKASQSAGRSLNGVAVQVQNGATTETLTASLSISGSSSRFHDVTLKHSLRLKFDGGAAAGAFLPGMGEQVILRHPTQDSWAQGGRWSALRASARYFADGMADQWLAARGHSHLKRRWVHVFLNQVYWGLYEAVEQQTAAEAGGTLLEPGSLGITAPIHGTDSAWRKLMADALTLSRRSRQGEEVGEAWKALLGRLDAGNLADYIALNIWLGNQDWPIQNYLISGADGRFHFLSWDAEWVMPVEKLTFPSPLASVLNTGDGPAALFSLLCDAPAFRQILRSQLTRESGFDDVDFKKLTKDSAAGIRPLLAAEAARWGFAYEPGADHLARWEGNVDWIVDKWIPGRAAKVREEIEKHLKSIETSQAAAALRAANQPASKMPDEPVPFVAALSSPPADRDGDGITDDWETAQGLDPDDPDDAASDPDGDGQSNLEEFLRKRNPRVKDATPRPAASVLTGTFNRMEKPVIRRGKTVDQTQAELLKLVPSAEEGAPRTLDSKPDKKSN